MIVGKLYKVGSRIGSRLDTVGSSFWCRVKNLSLPVLYLGEAIIERSDGVTVVNHAVFVDGQNRILARSFLKFLEPFNESR